MGARLQLGLRQEAPLGWMSRAGDGARGEDRGGGLGDGVARDEAGQPDLALESGRFFGPAGILEKLPVKPIILLQENEVAERRGGSHGGGIRVLT